MGRITAHTKTGHLSGSITEKQGQRAIPTSLRTVTDLVYVALRSPDSFFLRYLLAKLHGQRDELIYSILSFTFW